MVEQGYTVFAQGKGPGPKNVGVEFQDGTKVVYTYREYKKLMAEYVTACGFVQFDPREREANNQTVIDYTIKAPGSDGALVRVTVWPELQGEDIQKGDFIAVDGKLTIGSYTDNSGNARQSVQISATSLAVLKGVEKAEREVVNKPKGRATKSSQNDGTPIF